MWPSYMAPDGPRTAPDQALGTEPVALVLKRYDSLAMALTGGGSGLPAWPEYNTQWIPFRMPGRQENTGVYVLSRDDDGPFSGFMAFEDLPDAPFDAEHPQPPWIAEEIGHMARDAYADLRQREEGA